MISDADTGFGDSEMCAKTVWEYYNAGAAGQTKTIILFLNIINF